MVGRGDGDKNARGTGVPLIKSIERAVQLLNCFSPQKPVRTLGELRSELRTNRATVYRYAATLQRVGLLRYDSESGSYSLGSRIVDLAASALAGMWIIKLAAPHMRRLAFKVNETVVLSTLDGPAPVVVHTEQNTDRVVKVIVSVGSRLPLESAQGHLWCAFRPELQAGDVTRQDLAQIREQRIAVHDGVVEGIRSVAAPIFRGNEVIATLAVVGTTATIPSAADAPLAETLLATAGLVSAEVGFAALGEQSAGGRSHRVSGPKRSASMKARSEAMNDD